MRKIIVAGLSATIQETIFFDELALNGVNRSTGYRLDASGKGVNVARVLSQLEGAIPALLCAPGMDNASSFIDLVERDRIPAEFVPVPGKTRYCYTLLENKGGRATELVVGEPLRDGDEAAYGLAADELVQRLERHLLEGPHALILAGSRAVAFPEDTYLRMRSAARLAGVPVLADFHGKELQNLLRADPPDIVKINESEFLSTFAAGVFSPQVSDLACRVRREARRLGSLIIVTRGSLDVVCSDPHSDSNLIVPVDALGAVNPIGSGDAFTAGFIFEWARTGDLGSSIRKGIECGGLNALSVRPGSLVN